MQSFIPSELQYPKVKLLIVGLLTLNAVFYAVFDSLTSTVDAVTWLVLLVLYELETNGITFSRAKYLRDALIAVIVWVFFSYWHDSEWLDVSNSLLWFALIALMELEVRKPHWVLQHSNLYWLATIAVFSGLLAMGGIWLWRQAWLDAYDAILWIIAFGFIEVDILHLLKRRQAPS